MENKNLYITAGCNGAGKSTEQIIEENADKMAFALWNMGVKRIKN